MTTWSEWVAESRKLTVATADGRSWSISVRSAPAPRERASGAPHATLLHGFPTHSLDWAAVVSRLVPDVACTTLDFLGFGASDKPQEHEYSIAEQADLVCGVWSQEGIRRTTLVAHDYAVSVAQELLARRAEGALAVDLANVVFLNGGIYPDLHRAMPVQKMLLDPEQGPRIAALMTEEAFTKGLPATFAEGRFPSPADMHETWLGVSDRDGHRIGHRLIHYILDRRTHEARWVRALETTDVPRSFVWGMLDPVSGAHIAERIVERFPNDPKVLLNDVGHWPSIEAPDAVAAAVVAASRG
jgi:pimeloyl-ACP methyl ester carboxylesterase